MTTREIITLYGASRIRRPTIRLRARSCLYPPMRMHGTGIRSATLLARC